MVNRIWPKAVVGEADSVSSVSASACHIGGPNSVNPGQILLVYGMASLRKEARIKQPDLMMKLSNLLYRGVTPFWLTAVAGWSWHRDDTACHLPQQWAKRFYSTVCNLFYHQIFIRLYHYALGLLWWWWSYSYCATPHGSFPMRWNSTMTSGRWRKWRCVL